MYGDIRKVTDDNPDDTCNESILLQDILNMSQQLRHGLLTDDTLNETMLKQRKALEKQVSKVRKMDATETFIAIIKGYCGAVILFTPKAFAKGGFLFSSLTMVVSGIFTTFCAKKLV
jgi:hypothetical protein